MSVRQILLLELSDIIGPENADEMTNYVLSFSDISDIKAVLKDIIGNDSVVNSIATEIQKSRGQYMEEEERKTNLKPKREEKPIQPKQTDFKARNESTDVIQIQGRKKEESQSVEPAQSKQKKDEKPILFSKPVKSDIIPKAKCACLGTIHPVLFNCTECGNIICVEEEIEVCTYCGAFSRKYQYNSRGTAEEQEALRKAIESKNRLLQYDRNNTARSQVYDDQSDYFDLNDKWTGQAATSKDYKPVYEERSKMPIAISFDFTGKRVLVDEKRVASTKKETVSQHDARVSDSAEFYLPPTSSQQYQKSIHPVDKEKESHQYQNNTLNGKANLVYDALSKKLEHGLKLQELKIRGDPKKTKMSKNWKKADTYDY